MKLSNDALRLGREKLIKLDSNENPFGPSAQAMCAMQAALTQCNSYPDNDSVDLQHKLAKHHQLAPEQIVVTNGLTDLLSMIARTLLQPGLNAITSERSFIVYPIATKAAGGELIEVPMREDRFDLPAIAAAVSANSRVIFLANPNNPTGTLVTAEEVDDFLAHVPEHVTVVSDEAYYEFAQHFAQRRSVRYSRSLEYVRQNRNVVVLRTFSKVHGLAGVRVGYAIAPANLIAKIVRQRTIYSVSRLAQAAAMAALDDESHLQKTVENNAVQAQELTQTIKDLGFPVPLTWANFIYCETGQDAKAIREQIQSQGIAVRALDQWGAPTALRITIGTATENKTFVEVFRRIMKG
jgi:histidinol-phosphate aminotransferase